MKNVTLDLPCKPGDIIYIKAQDAEAVVIKLEITEIGIKVVARAQGYEWEFWECQLGKDYLVKDK